MTDAIEFDLPGVSVGVAEYPEGPTGVTAILFDDGAATAVDYRYGAVGLVGGYRTNFGIVFAGGSVYGLSAATGVAEELFDGIGQDPTWGLQRNVSGAIIYDFVARRDRTVYPDAALGRRAARAARTGVVPVGRVGAGANATYGKIDGTTYREGGQGAAFGVHRGHRILAVTVLNAVGHVFDRSGRTVGDPGHVHTAGEYWRRYLDEQPPDPPGGNTTLTAIVTDAPAHEWELYELGKQVHASLARAIQPFQTESDGDVLFVASTAAADPAAAPPRDPGTRLTGLGIAASELAWDAVLVAARSSARRLTREP